MNLHEVLLRNSCLCLRVTFLRRNVTQHGTKVALLPVLLEVGVSAQMLQISAVKKVGSLDSKELVKKLFGQRTGRGARAGEGYGLLVGVRD